MNKRIWYEVFESDKEGTRTLQIANTIGEAHTAQRNFKKRKGWGNKKIFIDKWENTDNPKKIGDVI